MNPVNARWLIEAVEESDYKPNAWERKFIRDMKKNYIDRLIFLNTKQGKKIQEIYRKSQGGY